MIEHGTRLGPYEIETPLGAGGMGEVYKDPDTRLDRSAALKDPAVAGGPMFGDRFPARSNAQIAHAFFLRRCCDGGS
jgi:hypothetical protein